MASSTITESEVLNAIMSSDDEAINRLIKSTAEGKTVVGKLAKLCFRELLNRHIILTRSIFEFIQKTLIACGLYPSLKEPAKSNTNGQRINRTKYTSYYMNEIAMHEGDPDELLWHNIQMVLACAYKVQHEVISGLPWRKLINYLNICRKKHLIGTGIDVDLVPKLQAIVTCFRNALEKSLLSKQKISQIKTTFHDEWMKTACDDYYWQLKNVDTVYKMIASLRPISDIKQDMIESGSECINSMQFLGILKVSQSIGELCKNTPMSPNMSETLANIFSRYVPDEIKRHLIDLRDKISHLKIYPKMRAQDQNLLMGVIEPLNLLSKSILHVMQNVLSEETTVLHEEQSFTNNDIIVFKGLLKLIDNAYHNQQTRSEIESNFHVCKAYQRDMAIIINNELWPDRELIPERNKIAHNDDVLNHLKSLFQTDCFPEAEIKLLLHYNHTIRKRHPIQLITIDNFKQSQLHIATIEYDVSKVSELLSSGVSVDQKDIAGFNAMFYAIRSASTQIFTLLYDSIKTQCASNTKIEWLLWAFKVSNFDVIDIVIRNSKQDILEYIENGLSLMPLCETIPLNFAEAMVTLLEYRQTQTIDVAFIDFVKLLLKSKSDINDVDSNGWTALHYVANQGYNKCVELLLNNNANINAITSRGLTALHIASYRGYEKCVELLLKNKSNINAVNSNGWTALHCAVFQGHANCVELLLNHYDDVNMVSSEGWTALHIASHHGYDKCVELLLKINSDMNAVTSDGKTPLHCAAVQGHDKCLELLLKKNADVNAVTKGSTAILALNQGHDKCVKLLSNSNSDIDATTSSDTGWTALQVASYSGHDKCVELLLNYQSDINAVDSNGFTALHFASNHGHDKCVELLLLNENSIINAVDSKGWTALHFASNEGHKNCVELLLKKKADINAVTSNGWTALHFAANQGHDQCVELLLNNNSNNINAVNSNGWTALHFASHQGYDKCVESLLNHKCDVNVVTSTGLSALHIASHDGHVKCVELLVKNKSDINAAQSDGWTPLHHAANKGHSKCVELLLKKNADVNAVTSKGLTALHLASYKGHDTCVKLLLQYKSDINVATPEGWTPLSFAVHQEHEKCVELLLNINTDNNVVNSDGCSNEGHDK